MLICIPHGGTKIPTEISDRVIIGDQDLLEDSDAFTQEIYNIGTRALKIIQCDYARAFIDVNRNVGDLPPEMPDGIVKSMTCYQKPIYAPGKEPNSDVVRALIENYYVPYHDEIKDALLDRELVLALDCHSMADVAPGISPDVGQKRPPVCLGNCFDETASNDTITKLAECFMRSFRLEKHEVALNWPFTGKYTAKMYGLKPIPWIHVELNRNLFMTEPWFDRETLKMNHNRLSKLNSMFAEALEDFFTSN